MASPENGAYSRCEIGTKKQVCVPILMKWVPLIVQTQGASFAARDLVFAWCYNGTPIP